MKFHSFSWRFIISERVFAPVCPQCSSPHAVTCFWYNIIARLETAPGKSLNSRQHCFWKYFLWNKGQTANIYLSLLRLVLTLPTVSACLHVPVSRVTCHVLSSSLVTLLSHFCAACVTGGGCVERSAALSRPLPECYSINHQSANAFEFHIYCFLH